MAEAIGEKPVTVNQWRARRSIPPRYWPKIIDAAERRGHRFTLEQFASAFLPAPKEESAARSALSEYRPTEKAS